MQNGRDCLDLEFVSLLQLEALAQILTCKSHHQLSLVVSEIGFAGGQQTEVWLFQSWSFVGRKLNHNAASALIAA
jgi:hypothetical protein